MLLTQTLVDVQVPFSMMILLDHVRKRDLPPELKCRQVPTFAVIHSTYKMDAPAISDMGSHAGRCSPRLVSGAPACGIQPTLRPCSSGWMSFLMQTAPTRSLR